MLPLVVISRENLASQNIKNALLAMVRMERQDGGFWASDKFNMAEYGGSIIEIVPSHDAEYYVFASTHKSESGKPNFTAHTPGNWGGADMGGMMRTLNISCGSRIAAAVRRMKKLSDGLMGWEVSVEADHHGPTLSRPVLFVEIGSTEKEWINPEAGKIAAEGVLAAIANVESGPVYVGFGGGHYCPKFGPKIIDGAAVFGHIIPGYSLEKDGIDDEMVKQALQKNVENVSSAAIDWKGMKGGTRAKLVSTLEALQIKWVRM